MRALLILFLIAVVAQLNMVSHQSVTHSSSNQSPMAQTVETLPIDALVLTKYEEEQAHENTEATTINETIMTISIDTDMVH